MRLCSWRVARRAGLFVGVAGAGFLLGHQPSAHAATVVTAGPVVVTTTADAAPVVAAPTVTPVVVARPALFGVRYRVRHVVTGPVAVAAPTVAATPTAVASSTTASVAAPVVVAPVVSTPVVTSAAVLVAPTVVHHTVPVVVAAPVVVAPVVTTAAVVPVTVELPTGTVTAPAVVPTTSAAYVGHPYSDGYGYPAVYGGWTRWWGRTTVVVGAPVRPVFVTYRPYRVFPVVVTVPRLFRPPLIFPI